MDRQRIHGLAGLDENQAEHSAHVFLEEARFLGKFSSMSKMNVLDIDMLSQFSLMLGRGKPDHSGKLVNIYLNDKVISAILESLYWLPHVDNAILRAITNTPRIIYALGNLIICIHVAAAWSAYLLSALFLMYERLPDDALELAPSIINAASRLIMNGSEENVDGCLLLINNMTAMGGDVIASYVANHWDLMNELKRSMMLQRHNQLRMRRIASIFHHLSRCDAVASILISGSLPQLLADVQKECRAVDGRQESPLHVGLAVLALANLSPVTGNGAIQDQGCLRLVVKFLKYAKDGKSYNGIFFRVPDILRALRFLCSKEENIQGMIEAGILDIIQQLLRSVFARDAGTSERRRVPLHIDVKALLALLLSIVQQETAIQKVIELQLASDVELLVKSSDPVVSGCASQLLWLIRDRERAKLLGHEVISSIQRFSSAVDTDHRPKEMIQGFLSECNISFPLAEACHCIAAILSLSDMETLGSEHYLHARCLLAKLQSKFGDLERSSQSQLKQADLEKDLLAQTLLECREQLSAEKTAVRIVQAELGSIKERLGLLSKDLEARTRELDQEKRLGESLRLQQGVQEARLRRAHQAELDSLQEAIGKERYEWERKLRGREEQRRQELKDQGQQTIVPKCKECEARQLANRQLLSLPGTGSGIGRPESRAPGAATVPRALQEDVDGLTHLLISAASPTPAKLLPRGDISALSQSHVPFSAVQPMTNTPNKQHSVAERAAPPAPSLDTSKKREWDTVDVLRSTSFDVVHAPHEHCSGDLEVDMLGKLIEDVLQMRAFLPA
jgi:hypothetical protein